MSVAPEVCPGSADAAVVLTCEHASADFPVPWRWDDADRWLEGTHWSFDLGIAEVTRGLARRLDAPAVLATFSRLLIDPNRELGHVDLFRKSAEGRPIALNRDLSDVEQRQRIEGLYEPYHREIAKVVHETPRAWVLSMHSFTPVYEGVVRPMELGVLFDREDDRALELAEGLRRHGWRVALNEPYSGKEGLIYSANRHALAADRPALEIEIRQDLATDPAQQERLVASIADAVRSVSGPPPGGSS